MKRIVPILLILFALCVCCGIGAHTSTSSDTSTSSGDQKPSTPAPPPVTVLGSPLSAFEARFGKPDHPQDWTTGKDLPDDYEFYPHFLGPNYGVHVINGKVSDIFILGLNNSDKSYCYSFRPPDAKLVASHPEGNEYDIYVSGTLAQKFPAALFTDTGDTTAWQSPLPATPGTFTTDFSLGTSSEGLASCHLYLGR